MHGRWFLGAVLLAGSAWAADGGDFRCLKSVGTGRALRLQFTFPAADGGVAQVTYENGSGRIPVRRVGERELRRVPGGRPSEFEIRWEEGNPGAAGGVYVMTVQGAVLGDFRYIRARDGKVFRFVEDAAAEGEEGCVWKSR